MVLGDDAKCFAVSANLRHNHCERGGDRGHDESMPLAASIGTPVTVLSRCDDEADQSHCAALAEEQ